MDIKRVFLIVLDSFGIGEQEDSYLYGDEGSNTLKSCFLQKSFSADNMKKMGLFNIDGVDYVSGVENPTAAYGRFREKSKGKDTTTGHWEICGIISETPLPTYPDGFPDEILSEFTKRTGRGVLCNKPYSGTQVIEDYGKEHIETGALIVASVLGFFGLSFLILSFFVVVGYFGEIFSILGLLLIFGGFFFF